MDKLKIVRPNGEEEIAELTTDKSLVGNNYLKLDIGGVPHYAKVGDVVDTHMYTFNGVDGKKYYIKKEIGNIENPPSGGDSLTLDIRGTLTLIQMPSDVYQMFEGTDGVYAIPREGAGVITNNTPKYSVTEIGAVAENGGVFIGLTVDDLGEFFQKFEMPQSVILNVSVGSLHLSMSRDGTNSIAGQFTTEAFDYLKENIGKPLNFSIKYP